jgi:hypothetical protein
LRASDGDMPDYTADQTSRPRTMPVVSKAQNAAMHAAAAGKSTLGIPKKVGADFVSATTPGSVKNLPQYAPKRARGGPVEADEAYEVGEEGPETFMPKKGSVAKRVKALEKHEKAEHRPNMRMLRKQGMISDRAAAKRLGKYAGTDQEPIDASSR